MTPAGILVLDAIRTGIEQNGCAPTYAQIAERAGLKSKSSVYRVVEMLVADGVITRRAACARSIWLAGQPCLPAATTEALRAELARRGAPEDRAA